MRPMFRSTASIACLLGALSALNAGCGGGGSYTPVYPKWTEPSAAEKQAGQGNGRVYCLEAGKAIIQVWDKPHQELSKQTPFIRIQGAEAERMAKEAGVELPAIILTDSHGNRLGAFGGYLKGADITAAVKALPDAIAKARKDIAAKLAEAKALAEKQPAKAKEQFARIATLKGYAEAGEAREALAKL